MSIDDQIRRAIAEGRMSNLPGEGKPLRLDEDPYTPDDLKLAHRMLKEQGFAPEWMMHGKYIDERLERLKRSIKRGVDAYRGALADAARSTEPALRTQEAEAAWSQTRLTLVEAGRALNREITSYNLKVPTGVTHKHYIDVAREIERLLQTS